MAKYFYSGLYEHAFYVKHEIDFDSDKTAYEDIEYNSELLGEYYKKDIGLKYNNENAQMEQVSEMFWDNLSCGYTYFEPLIFNEEVAVECFLTPFTYKGKGMLALAGYGIDLTPRLEAYQALVHNTIDRKSRFLSSGSGYYFESVVGKEVSEKVLQAIERYSEEDGKAMKYTEYTIVGKDLGTLNIDGNIMARKAKITDIFTTYSVNQDINQIKKQLIESIKDKKLEQVKGLMEVGVDINFKDDQNVTALMHAAYIGSADIVKILIEAGANILAKDINDDTALVYAAKAGKALIIDILIFAKRLSEMTN